MNDIYKAIGSPIMSSGSNMIGGDDSSFLQSSRVSNSITVNTIEKEWTAIFRRLYVLRKSPQIKDECSGVMYQHCELMILTDESSSDLDFLSGMKNIGVQVAGIFGRVKSINFMTHGGISGNCIILDAFYNSQGNTLIPSAYSYYRLGDKCFNGGEFKIIQFCENMSFNREFDILYLSQRFNVARYGKYGSIYNSTIDRLISIRKSKILNAHEQYQFMEQCSRIGMIASFMANFTYTVDGNPVIAWGENIILKDSPPSTEEIPIDNGVTFANFNTSTIYGASFINIEYRLIPDDLNTLKKQNTDIMDISGKLI